MRKSIYVIAAMGLAACLAMSLLMKHLLQKQDERRNPLVHEAEELFGARLDGPMSWRVEVRDGVRIGVLTIIPLTSVSNNRLAKDIGQYVWRRLEPGQRPDRLEVHCVDRIGEGIEIVAVPPPYLRRDGQRREAVRPPR